ncbi:probable glutamate carboxypeptidase AMP1 isoform X2 [Spinacia oleracea]|uniref:Probable glutamate carboxypeptidase AMP1 isoform X2 n=1 Tax=Spinacia oleracea TaxID=3562 RepID=A0ABM3RCB4_SPIOL|nr:probable glutamate carboxypeptidase AMP1 isoform X2 [Spinacia oleracea]
MSHKLCSALFKRPTTTFLFILLFCILGFYILDSEPLNHKSNETKTHKASKPPTGFHDTFLSLSSNYTVSEYLRSLTLHPHLAGTPEGYQTAQYVKTHFESLNLETKVSEYEVLLSYPVKISLTAHFSNLGSRVIGLSEVGFDVVRPYHAYAPSGKAVGAAVFANYGREEDYRALGVNVSGSVVVVRRGEGMSRGGVVRAAEGRGAAAVLTYTEGEYVKGVERGTVMKGLGDPLSPGWGSVVEGGEKLERSDTEVEDRFPKIPSMPISFETAEAILRSLEGPQVPLEWRDALKNSNFRAGPGPTVLNFTNQVEDKNARIHDVFAVIRGSEEPDRYVLLGNHRDAWTFGAVDPNSGTAVLLDVARRYAFLMRLGWRPRRTIILCSWDAEEFGMIGSTEWVENNIMNLGSRAVAYLNVDCAVQGPGLFTSMTPQLDDLVIDITKKDPDAPDITIYDEWTGRNKGINIQRLSGVDSDFAPFLQHVGIPSVDMYFGKDFPVYHTAFDSYDWMSTHGDPLFRRHAAVAGLWGLLALRLADDPILPFNYSSYAMQLQEYTSILSNKLEGRISFTPIFKSVKNLLAVAQEVEEEAKELRVDGGASSDVIVLKKRMLNDRLMLAERGFLDADGLQGNRWFKHLVYGPSNKYDSNIDFFPSIANAISQSTQAKKDNQATIRHEIWRVARAIQRAADALKGDLS